MNVFKIIKLLIINHSNIKTEVSMKEKNTLCTIPYMHIYIYKIRAGINSPNRSSYQLKF